MNRAWLLMALAITLGCSTTEDQPAAEERPPYKDVASRLRPTLTPEQPPEAPGELEVHVIDVGHGDAILIRCPDGDHQLLIDTGELDERWRGSEKRFKAYLERIQAEDDPLEVVVLSHPDADAMGSMKWLLKRYEVGYYVDNGCTSPFRTWSTVEEQLTKRPPAFYLNVYRSEEHVLDIDFCPRTDVSAVALRPSGFGQSPWLDDGSVVVRVDYGERSFLFMGDAQESEETLLVGDPELQPLLDVDFLKVGRHGASNSSTEPFLAAVTPELAAIPCGKSHGINKFLGEPRLDVIQRLEAHLRQRPDGPAVITVCDGAAERPEEADVDTGIFFFVNDPGHWNELETSLAVYLSTREGDLVFASDGERIWRRDGAVTPPSNPHPQQGSDQ